MQADLSLILLFFEWRLHSLCRLIRSLKFSPGMSAKRLWVFWFHIFLNTGYDNEIEIYWLEQIRVWVYEVLTLHWKFSSLCAPFPNKASRAEESFSFICLHLQLNTEEETKDVDICTNVYENMLVLVKSNSSSSSSSSADRIRLTLWKGLAWYFWERP